MSGAHGEEASLCADLLKAAARAHGTHLAAVAVRRLHNGVFAVGGVGPTGPTSSAWLGAWVPGGRSKGTEAQAQALAESVAREAGVPRLRYYHAGAPMADVLAVLVAR